MKKFLFSMALALGAICMPSQANAAEMASPVVNPVKAAAPVSLASTEDDDVVIQLMPGVKIMSTTVGERTRRHPITQEEIVCEPTCKVKTKISYDFMSKVQETYNNKKDG